MYVISVLQFTGVSSSSEECKVESLGTRLPSEIINNTRDGVIIFFNETKVNAAIEGNILISELGPILP